MIRVLCPHCKRRYRTVTEAMGRQAVCHNCHIRFVIGQDRPPFSWKPTDLVEDSWIGVEPPQEKESLRHCFMCDAPLEPGAVVCPSCGSNQVTGVVHRTRPAESAEVKHSFLDYLPRRWLLAGAAVVALAGAGAWLVSSVRRTTDEMTTDLADQALLGRAVRFLREGGDELDFARQFAGQISDENLPRFIPRLSSRDAEIRRAAVGLVACGRFARIEPLVSATDSPGSGAGGALEAIGPRRLVELSCDADESVRRPAARALCLVTGLDDGKIEPLAAPGSPAQKTALLNEWCRYYPEAVGPFAAVIEEQRSELPVLVEQVARTFYLRIGHLEFWSAGGGARRFEIPIEHWCAATGQAVDAAGLRRLVGGQVTLESPYGVGWLGTVRVTTRQPLLTDLPGFLPFKPPDRGQTVEVPVRLERPGR